MESSNWLGIVVANHTGYVDEMFKCMESGNVAIPLRNVEDSDRIHTTGVSQVVTPLPPSGAWMQRSFTPSSTDATALIAFTSGTEGSAKGVMLTHQNLADVVNRLNSLMQLDGSVSEYIGVPVYHSFGFGRCRAVATVGGRFFIPSNGFNPAEIGSLLKNGEINAISAVPSLWRILLANQDLIGHYGRRVRWIEIGSQYMSHVEKEALKALFPEARIVQHYGLTEASRTTLLEIHNTTGNALESVGRAVGSVDIRLTEEGLIAIRGDHVAKGYLVDGKAASLKDDNGWFVTKDLGSWSDGYLYYQGRADDVINCGGIKVHPEALETRIFTHIGYSRGLAICRKPDPMRGDGFLVAVTQEIETDRNTLREVVAQAVQKAGVNAGNAITFVEVDSLPTTATGKIQRKKLAELYATPDFTTETGDFTAQTTGGNSSIKSIFSRTLNVYPIDPNATFISLGGDSLSYVQLSMELERHLGYLPKKWEKLPLHELEKLVPQKRFNGLIEMNILLRALAITGIALNHSGFHILEGGLWLLLLMTGVNFARFQGCMLIQGKLRSILPLLQHVTIPYLVIVIAYQIFKQRFDPLVLMMLSNFESPERQAQNIVFVWFVANLVQTVVLFSLLFKVRTVRDFVKVSPWRFGIVTLGLGVVMRLVGPYIWDSSSLSHQVPHMLFWIFSLGWCIHFAKTNAEKIITNTLVIALTATFIGVHSLASLWVLVGASLLIWLPYVPILKIIKTPLQTVSAASYYVYLTIIISITLVTKTVGMGHPFLTATVILSGGVVSWMIAESIQRYFATRCYRKMAKGITDF